MNKEDHYKNIIRAGALGDVFGYNVEFQSWEYIMGTFGEPLNFTNCPSFIASDDTQMTLFCLEALKEKPELNNNNEEIINKIYNFYLEWNKTQYPKSSFEKEFSKQKILHQRQAPGNTCLQALGSKKMGTLKQKINDSKGCGAIMRVAPLAFLNRDLKDIIELGCKQGAITHGHPEGYLSSGFFVGLLKQALDRITFDVAYEKVKKYIAAYPDSSSFIYYLNKIEGVYEEIFINPNKMTQAIGEGWTGESALGLAIYAFKMGKNFEETLMIATNHCGDSDSTASLAGQLYAAFKNIEKNDCDAYQKVDLYEVIENSLKDIRIINQK